MSTTHLNAERLVVWLREHRHRQVSVADIARTGLMSSREASEVTQFAVRHGVMEAVAQPGAGVQYRLTGRPLPVARKKKTVAPTPSFDALLGAWGIAGSAPSLPATRSTCWHPDTDGRNSRPAERVLAHRITIDEEPD